MPASELSPSHRSTIGGVGVSARPEHLVTGLAGLLFAVAVVCVVVSPTDVDFGQPFGSLTFVVIALTFGALEMSFFTVQYGRQSLSFALNEVPIAFAIVFLGPVEGPLARLPLTVLVLFFVRSNRGHKLAFNVALHLAEVAVAGLVFRGLVSWWGRDSLAVVAAVAVTLVTVIPVMAAMISVAISMFEGNARKRIVDDLRASWWFYPLNSVFAATAVALALLEPALTVLGAIPILGMWFMMHAYGKVNQELRDLGAVHGFAGRVGDTLDPDAIGDVAVEESSRMFRASGAVLIRFIGDEPTVHTHGSLSTHSEDAVRLADWADLIEQREVVQLSRARLPELGIDAASNAIVLMTTLDDDGGMPAVLAVARENVIHEQFDEGDRARLDHIGRQLSVSLRRGMLHERLEWEARHDALTGLPARTLFERHVAEATGPHQRGIRAVMMLDLDRFKEVNDTLGHHAGDALLVEFSRRMAALLGPEDTLARLAGDEFAILCHRDRPDDVLELAQRAVREGGRPVVLDGLEIVVTVSLGVAEITPHDTEAIQPMRRADIAMYNAKWQRTGVEFYRDEIDRRTPARLSMLGDLRTAIETDQLTVVYQPKLDLRSGVVVGLEALVRWDHPARGTVPPSEFVRVAEDTGLIKQLTDLVLASGIEKLAEMRRRGLDIGLAVNLSTHDLFDARLPERVKSYLEDSGVEPSKLTLEITESSLFVDAPRTRATIDGL
ncbi:MAG: diguanylate cyclase, partial [Ilumatobacter sp.]|nr:diguanylate cyclase [Ilumatobacter sp.]